MISIVAASCIGLLGSCYVLLLATGQVPVCTTESQKKITDLSGFDFEVATTYCSGFGASARTKVFVSRRGERGQTLLFDYDPIDWIELPTISIPAKDKIVIAAPWVIQIFARRYEWRGMQIEYEIGKVTYPSGDRRLNESD